MQAVFREDIFSSNILQGMHTLQEFRLWFDAEVLTPLLEWTKEQQQRRDINITQVMIETIQRNYDKELSLEMLAASMNYHPGYVGREFKKDTGTNFIDYLAKYRIEISKKWLTETEMKIGDIAQSLCYSNASNFNRNFKKLVKLTPTEYREMNKK
ncbi:helix-turn-helix domain-containing protein [Paenibacillus chungangensis]|uniref:Helix-turn-helix domain-containing protein n=1 Tax=Paenibacillus chungangensis TaxID=696535 RepID=A0ABW3HW68_9BACL